MFKIGNPVQASGLRASFALQVLIEWDVRDNGGDDEEHDESHQRSTF